MQQNSLSILHSADWHIRDSHIDECRKVLDALVQEAITTGPDLILLAGDLTHRFDAKLGSQTARLLLETVDSLSTIAPVGIVGGTPFHEGQIPDIINTLRRRNVFIALDYPCQAYLFGDQIVAADSELCAVLQKRSMHPDALLSFIPALTKKFMEVSGSMENADNTIETGMGLILANYGAVAQQHMDIPHIVVGHWSIGGAYISEHQMMTGRDIEISRDQVELAHADLVCLGHIHKAQKIGENIFYSGSTYSLDAGELDDKGFFLHTITDKGPRRDLSSRFVELPATKRIVIKRDFTADGSAEIISLDQIVGAYTADDIVGKVVKISIKAFQDQADTIDKTAIENHFRYELGAGDCTVEMIRVPRENVRSKEFFLAVTLHDKLKQQALLRGEPPLFDGVLEKANLLESLPPDRIVSELPKAA